MPNDASRLEPYDNSQGNYILRMMDIIGDDVGDQFQILALLGHNLCKFATRSCVTGQGTFGQVVRCRKLSTSELFAIKLIKNIPAYLQQSLAEITIL